MRPCVLTGAFEQLSLHPHRRARQCSRPSISIARSCSLLAAELDSWTTPPTSWCRASDDVAVLKKALVDDLGLAPIAAAKLAKHLFEMLKQQEA